MQCKHSSQCQKASFTDKGNFEGREEQSILIAQKHYFKIKGTKLYFFTNMKLVLLQQALLYRRCQDRKCSSNMKLAYVAKPNFIHYSLNNNYSVWPNQQVNNDSSINKRRKP